MNTRTPFNRPLSIKRLDIEVPKSLSVKYCKYSPYEPANFWSSRSGFPIVLAYPYQTYQAAMIKYAQFGFVLEKAMIDKSPQLKVTTDKSIQTNVYYDCFEVILRSVIRN